MYGKYNLSRLLTSCLALLSLVVLPRSVVAAPLQAGPSLTVPWWVWLVAISLFLLIAFVVFISLSWRDSPDSVVDHDEHQ